MKLKLLDIFSLSFAFQKFLPGSEEILKRDDIIKCMNSFSKDFPPPQLSERFGKD